MDGGGVLSRGGKSGRSREPSSQKIFNQILIWQKFFGENHNILLFSRKKQYNDIISASRKNFFKG